MPKKRLTVQGIKALKAPGQGRIDYHDETLPGLVLRVAASGQKSYSVQYRTNGKRPRVTLGDASLLSLTEARERARKILREVRLGIDPAAEKRERDGAITFAELADEYVTRWAKIRKTTKGAREDETRINNVLIPRWGTRAARDVGKRDVIELLDEYTDAGKPYARNRMQSLMSKIYSFGIKRDAVEFNPARDIDREPEKPRKRVLADDELKKLLPLFREAELAGLGFRLLLLTGQRPAEVFGMRWSEIDGDTWALPKERTKNRRSKYAPDSHQVPLSPQALEVLRELRAYDNGAGFVFPSPTRTDTPFTNYQKCYRAMKKDAMVTDDWRVYDLKSTCLTGLEGLGVAPPTVSAIAGHLPTSVTRQHYAFHDFADEKREALDRWGAHVEKLDPTRMAGVVELRRGAR